jgi:hypothetical protein
MELLRTDLGSLPEGSRVSVHISAPANVRLMVTECAVFRDAGFPYLSYGGLYSGGTVTIDVPEEDHWVLDVDLEGRCGAVRTSRVRVTRPRRRVFA